jgi:hypothetical protein
VSETRFGAITSKPRGFRALLFPVLLLLFFVAVAAVAVR